MTIYGDCLFHIWFILGRSTAYGRKGGQQYRWCWCRLVGVLHVSRVGYFGSSSSKVNVYNVYSVVTNQDIRHSFHHDNLYKTQQNAINFLYFEIIFGNFYLQKWKILHVLRWTVLRYHIQHHDEKKNVILHSQYHHSVHGNLIPHGLNLLLTIG